MFLTLYYFNKRDVKSGMYIAIAIKTIYPKGNEMHFPLGGFAQNNL
ncbi:MAG: hypothetical protein ACTHKJ_05855 [Candidatus Nitrosocosmicus sp.]